MNPTYEEIFWIKEAKINLLPWINAPKIVAEIEVEGNSWWGGGQAETTLLQFDATPYSVGQVVTFNGFGFKPKKVIIQGSSWVGIGYFNANGDKRDQSTNRNSETGYLMYLDNWGGTWDLFQASLLDFTDDGFRVTIWSKTNDYFFCYATCFSNI
jgi:hypothetical protein